MSTKDAARRERVKELVDSFDWFVERRSNIRWFSLGILIGFLTHLAAQSFFELGKIWWPDYQSSFLLITLILSVIITLCLIILIYREYNSLKKRTIDGEPIMSFINKHYDVKEG